MSGRIDRDVGRSIFGRDPAGYHAARLDYPDALYERLFDGADDNPIRAIVEIGAGTGHATAKLLAPGVERLVAVEPDAALATYLGAAFEGQPVEVVNSDFVSASVAGTFDLAAAASSFHWLDPDAALPRIHAMLRPRGRIALWWNAYRQPGIGDPFADATMPLLNGIDLPPSESMRGHYSLDADLHSHRLRAAGFDSVDHQIFRRERILSAADARALYASYSFVRALPEDRRAALLEAIGNLVDQEFAGAAPNVVLTALYLGRRSA